MLKPGDVVFHVFASEPKGEPYGDDLHNVPVSCVDPLSNTIGFGDDDEPYFLAEYWCTSFLGHVGMPCVFCGDPNVYMRLPESEYER